MAHKIKSTQMHKNVNIRWNLASDLSPLWSPLWVLCWSCEVTFSCSYITGVCVCVHLPMDRQSLVQWLHTVLEKKRKSIPLLDSTQLEAFFNNSIICCIHFAICGQQSGPPIIYSTSSTYTQIHLSNPICIIFDTWKTKRKTACVFYIFRMLWAKPNV